VIGRLEELLVLVEGAGLRVNNLFQTSDDRWQVNLQERNLAPGTREVFHEFGIAATPFDALVLALTKAGVEVGDG
jgi:hypothetical protein